MQKIDEELTPPSPTGGWSRQITSHKGAVAFPPVISKMVQPCGVQDAKGVYIGAAATWRGKRPLMTPADEPAVPVAKLAGRYLWCGQLWAHFGHYMAESLARIWGFDHDNPPDGLIFIPKRPGRTEELMGYQREFLTLMGIDVPVHVLSEPTEVEELIVPGQGFGLGEIDCGTPEFRAFFKARFGVNVAPYGPEKIYLSRSCLGGNEGSVILEDVLEANMAADGYEILHPQKHSIERQIAFYKAAKFVVGPDGSAFHLFGFVADKSQKSAVILRRNTSVFNGLKNQIEAFSGVEPQVVSAVQADWIPTKHNRPGRFSYGQLDFAKVAKDLAEMGFVGNAADWQVPAFRKMKQAIEAYGKEKNMTFLRRKKVDKPKPGEMAA